MKHGDYGYRNTSGERFHFDSMDTLPYWYAGLGRLFSISSEEFLKIAEKWICDKWGFAYDNREMDSILRSSENSYNYTLRSNSHGSEPMVEELQKYLEFNAMFCVASELISNKHPVEDRYEKDGWTDWLKQWDVMFPNCWIADKRGRTPMEPQFWPGGNNNITKEPPSNAEFDLYSEAKNPFYRNHVLVSTRIHRFQNGIRGHVDSESINIDTVLVPESKASKILYALQKEPNPYKYCMPYEAGIGDIPCPSVCVKKIPLKEWVRYLSGDISGIEGHDPFRYELTNSWILPGQVFQGWARKYKYKVNCSSVSCQDTHSITIFEKWNDCSGDRNYAELRTEGERLWIRKPKLLQFLKEGSWSLVIRCLISKRLGDNYKDGKFDPLKIYILRSDGMVETTDASWNILRH